METHDEKIIRLLKKDAEKKEYFRSYMRQYRQKKKEVDASYKQKQYYKLDDMKKRSKEAHFRKSALNDIRLLFI